MSVAEKMPSPEQPRVLNQVATPNIDNILRLAMSGAAGHRVPAVSAPSSSGERSTSERSPGDRSTGERATGDVDFGKAAVLLDRATGAIAHLTARREELEQAAHSREEFYAEKVRQLQDQAAEWERRAKVIKAQLQDCETRLSDQQSRIDHLSYRAETAESRVAAAEQQASEARKQLQLYHDKIMETFGALA